MKKGLFIFLLLCLSLLLTGCSETTINCGVDQEHNAYINMDLKINLSQVPESHTDTIRKNLTVLKNGFYRLGGYEVVDNITENTPEIAIHISKKQKTASYAEAFDTLKKMLTDENLTPFTTLSMDRQEGEFEEGFILEGTLNGDKLLETANIEDFPKEMKKMLQGWFKESTAKMTLTLPATSAPEHTGDLTLQDGLATCVSDLSLTEETTVRLITRASLLDGAILSADALALRETKRTEQERFLRQVILGAGVAFLFFVFLFVFLAVRRRRKAGRHV